MSRFLHYHKMFVLFGMVIVPALGWRIGYIIIHDLTNVLVDVRDGIERLLRSRLCASTPAQLGYLAGLEGDRGWMAEHSAKVQNRRQLCLDRIAKSNLEVEALGAFYMFARLQMNIGQKATKSLS